MEIFLSYILICFLTCWGWLLTQKFYFYVIEFISIFFYGFWIRLIVGKGNSTPRSLREHPVFLLGLEYFSLCVFKYFIHLEIFLEKDMNFPPRMLPSYLNVKYWIVHVSTLFCDVIFISYLFGSISELLKIYIFLYISTLKNVPMLFLCSGSF